MGPDISMDLSCSQNAAAARPRQPLLKRLEIKKGSIDILPEIADSELLSTKYS
jgi:hypothetical protein